MYKCPWCGRVFTRIVDLTRHIKSTHINFNGEITCPCCYQKFNSFRALSQHLSYNALLDHCHALLYITLSTNNGREARELRRFIMNYMAIREKGVEDHVSLV